MTDIYGIESVIGILPPAIFLSLLSLIIIILIYALVSKEFLNKDKLDQNKQIFEKYDFESMILNLEKKQNNLDNESFFRELLYIYIKFLSYEFQVDFSSKTLEEVKKISIIKKCQFEIFAKLYLFQYSKDYDFSSNWNEIFEITKKQILY